MIDISIYLNSIVRGIPLVFPVFILVEVLKALKNKAGEQLITGNGLLMASMGIGLVLGLGFAVFQEQPPSGAGWYAGYVYWFAAAVYGIGLGGLASLFFDVLKALVTAAIEKLVKRQALIKPPE